MRERYEIMKAMHTLIRAMNDEGAYCSWIYTVPDGATDDDLWDIAEDDELFAEACTAFKSAMKDYGKSGFYIDNRVW